MFGWCKSPTREWLMSISETLKMPEMPNIASRGSFCSTRQPWWSQSWREVIHICEGEASVHLHIPREDIHQQGTGADLQYQMEGIVITGITGVIIIIITIIIINQGNIFLEIIIMAEVEVEVIIIMTEMEDIMAEVDIIMKGEVEE